MNDRTSQRQERTAEVLRRRVLRALHAGTLRPGDRLPSARELAREFGVDQRLLLAAYRELAEDGLVEMRARGGVYVAPSLSESGVLGAPPERWIVETLVQAVARDVPIIELHEWLRRSVETLRLRALVVEGTDDVIEALARELRDDYGLETTGMDVARLGAIGAIGGDGGAPAELPVELRRSDLVVTTTAYLPIATAVARAAGVPCVGIDLRPDLLAGEWQLLLRQPVYIVVRDRRFVGVLRRLFDEGPNGENARILVTDEDDLGAIPVGAPVYVTRSARAALGAVAIPGRILPAMRLLTSESAREIVSFIVRANRAALVARLSR